MKIDEQAVLTRLANQMGRRVIPGGDIDDLKRYCQDAFEYAWRYYKWQFSLRRGEVDLTADALLPKDFDIDGWHQAHQHQRGNAWVFVPVEEYENERHRGSFIYTLEYVPASERYKVITNSTADTMTLTYQVQPPQLSEGAPFPSAMTVALGALTYAKRGENPTTADVSQEWDAFHHELDRHVARAYTNKPRTRQRNRYDIAGIGTGES